MRSLPRHFQAAVFALSGFFLFSVTDVIAKFLTGDISASAIAFWSGLAGFFTLILCAPWLGGLENTLKTQKKKWHALRALLTVFIQIFNFIALKHMPLVNFYTVIFTAPFVTAILATIFFNEHISRKNWALIALGFGGVLIAMRPSTESVGLAELAVLGSALFFAIRNMIVPKMGAQETTLSYGFYTYGGIAIGSFIAMLFSNSDFLPPSDAWVSLIVVGALGAAGIVLTSTAFRVGPTAVAAPMHYSQIIWGLIFGAMFFADIPDQWDLVGAAVVCLCGILLLRPTKL